MDNNRKDSEQKQRIDSIEETLDIAILITAITTLPAYRGW